MQETRAHSDARRRLWCGAALRLHHAAPRPVAHRRLPAGRRRRRAQHARLRRRSRDRRTACRDRHHPADVRRRPAVPPRGTAGGAPNRHSRARSRKAASPRFSAPLAAHAFGWAWPAAIVFGLTLSVASTVVLVRVLSDRRQLHTPAGHIAVGWLVVQDVLTVDRPRAAADAQVRAHRRPALATSVGITLLKVAGLVAVAAIVGKRVIPVILDRIAATRSRELFTLTVLALAIGLAVGLGGGVWRLDGARRVPRRHGRRPLRLQPARRHRRAADARRIRRAVLRVGRHAAAAVGAARAAVASSSPRSLIVLVGNPLIAAIGRVADALSDPHGGDGGRVAGADWRVLVHPRHARPRSRIVPAEAVDIVVADGDHLDHAQPAGLPERSSRSIGGCARLRPLVRDRRWRSGRRRLVDARSR